MSGASWVAIPEGSPYPISNLPLGVGHTDDGRWRAWVAVGDSALDLDAAHGSGAFDDLDLPDRCFAESSLNRYLAAGPSTWSALRSRLTALLTDNEWSAPLRDSVVLRSSITMGVPTAPTDYVDFYSSLHHATNLGRLFRPDGDALLPNWRHIPTGYHGRCGTLVADGSPIPRPGGLRLVDGALGYGPSRSLDVELEVGTIIGVGSDRGHPIGIDDADRHLYGMCLVNDWSARDIQAYEYQPLGPFLGKSFATSVSPWLVSLEALEAFRIDPPVQDPPVADYLSTDRPWGFDLHLEMWLDSAKMRADARSPVCLSRMSFADTYWTPAQQLAHMTVNGAGTRAGDLFASGTVSGPTPGSEGSLIELTWGGDRPLRLPDGSSRAFLLDGDRVTITGWAGIRPGDRIGLGSVSGTIVEGHPPT